MDVLMRWGQIVFSLLLFFLHCLLLFFNVSNAFLKSYLHHIFGPVKIICIFFSSAHYYKNLLISIKEGLEFS